MVLHLPAESIREASVAAHCGSHGPILPQLPLYERSGNVLVIRVPSKARSTTNCSPASIGSPIYDSENLATTAPSRPALLVARRISPIPEMPCCLSKEASTRNV